MRPYVVTDILRWGGLIPALILAGFGVLNSGLHAYSIIEANFCGSAACNTLGAILLRGIEFGVPALSALTMIFLAVLIAPAHRIWINWLVLALGGIAVIGLVVVGISPLPHGLTAIGAGYLGARWLAVRLDSANSALVSH